ncbi:oligosaccharide flippase family protein [Moellerella wisconsensis]|uniref:oligosaccharide flippase family protein n=1 Tax=Moellerella wisconsensis TaxID=158849 RepID=UPI0030762A25
MDIRIIKNATWMMSEKTISIVGLFLVTSYVAKYIGPEIFGIIALATATFQIIQIIAQLGNDNIIFKRVSKKRESGVKLIKSTFTIRTIIYIILSLPTLYYFYSYKNNIAFIFSITICITCYLSSIDIYSIYNNAILKSKINTLANIAGLSIGLSLQYLIVYFKLNPVILSIPIIATTFIPLCIRFLLFSKNNKVKIKTKNILRYNKYILISGLSIVFSTLSIAIYTRVNQFMISYLDGDYNLGIYSVAVTLATSWSFILSALINSTLPTIFGEKDNFKSLLITANLNLIVITISLIVLFLVYFFGDFFVYFLFGKAYEKANNVLFILCISTMISSLGMVSTRFIIRYSGYSFLSKKMSIMVIFSILFCATKSGHFS